MIDDLYEFAWVVIFVKVTWGWIKRLMGLE